MRFSGTNRSPFRTKITGLRSPTTSLRIIALGGTAGIMPRSVYWL
jgi:hypothetical protein